jgi:ribosomal protein S18 acetylase RimI-like enzyme
MNIQPVTGQTYRQAACLLGRAFMTDPVSIAAYKDFSSERMLRSLTNDFRAEMRICLRKAYPIQVSDGNNLFGVAVIYLPGQYPLPRLAKWRLLIQSYLQNGFYDLRDWTSWLTEVERHHPLEPHYYLEYIGVEPGYQGQGVGSAMLRHLITMADEAQAGCHLENANPKNLPIYEHFGFQVSQQIEVIGLTTWLMWRSPAKISG